jgi:hypothetical protein
MGARAGARGRVLALSRLTRRRSWVSHWSSRLLAGYLARHEKVIVSHVCVADLRREVGLKPWRQAAGHLQVVPGPVFAAKVTDVVGRTWTRRRRGGAVRG